MTLPSILQRRDLMRMLLLAAVVIAAFNVATFLLVQRTVPHRLLLRLQNPAPVEGIFLGNSLMEAGFNADVFQATWPDHGEAFANASMAWTTPVEHDLLFHYTLQRQPRVRFAVYGFFDFQMTEPPFRGWQDIEGNKVISYMLEPEHAMELYGVTSWFDRWQLRGIRFLPMVSERDWLWNHVDDLRRVLGGLGMPPEKMNRFGKVDAFRMLEAASTARFQEECREELDRNAPLVAPMAEMAAMARARGIQFFVVEMPMPSAHRRTFYETEEWRQYRAHVQALVEQAGGVYLRGDEWVPDDGSFMDAIHLNEAGGRAFSGKLAETLAPLVKSK